MNAKKEILEHIGNKEVEHIKIVYGREYWNMPIRYFEGGADVIDQLNFEYDEGFGSQDLFGFIWCSFCYGENAFFGANIPNGGVLL